MAEVKECGNGKGDDVGSHCLQCLGMWGGPACAGCSVGAVHVTKSIFDQRALRQLGTFLLQC